MRKLVLACLIISISLVYPVCAIPNLVTTELDTRDGATINTFSLDSTYVEWILKFQISKPGEGSIDFNAESYEGMNGLIGSADITIHNNEYVCSLSGYFNAQNSTGDFSLNEFHFMGITGSMNCISKVFLVDNVPFFTTYSGLIAFSPNCKPNGQQCTVTWGKVSVAGFLYNHSDNEFELLHNKIGNLENEKSVIEENISILTSRLATLESKINTLQNWLFFSSFSNNNVCEAITAQCNAPIGKCKTNSECGVEAWQGDTYCYQGNVWQQKVTNFVCHNGGTNNAYCSNTTTSQLKTACSKKCLNGACVDCLTNADCTSAQTCVSNICQGNTPPSGKCSFRTSAVNGNYAKGTWIAVDTNADGKLEGFDYTTSSGLLIGCSGTLLAKTPQGYEVRLNTGGKPYVCTPSSSMKVQKIYGVTSSTAITSSSPTAPYTANGQEVCS